VKNFKTISLLSIEIAKMQIFQKTNTSYESLRLAFVSGRIFLPNFYCKKYQGKKMPCPIDHSPFWRYRPSCRVTLDTCI